MQAVGRAVSGALVAAGVVCLWVAWPQSLGGRVAYVKVDGRSMEPTYHFGDLAVVQRQASYRVGDPVAYKIPQGEFGAGALIIHRLTGGDGEHGFVTQGDNRTIADPWHPRTRDVVGKVRFDVPGAGTRFAQAAQPVYLGGLVAAVTVAVMLFPSRTKTPTARAKHRPTRGRNRSKGLPRSSSA